MSASHFLSSRKIRIFFTPPFRPLLFLNFKQSPPGRPQRISAREQPLPVKQQLLPPRQQPPTYRQQPQPASQQSLWAKPATAPPKPATAPPKPATVAGKLAGIPGKAAASVGSLAAPICRANTLLPRIYPINTAEAAVCQALERQILLASRIAIKYHGRSSGGNKDWAPQTSVPVPNSFSEGLARVPFTSLGRRTRRDEQRRPGKNTTGKSLEDSPD